MGILVSPPKISCQSMIRDSAAQKILQNKNDIHDSMNSVNMSARVSRGNSLHRNVMKCLE